MAKHQIDCYSSLPISPTNNAAFRPAELRTRAKAVKRPGIDGIEHFRREDPCHPNSPSVAVYLPVGFGTCIENAALPSIFK